MPFVELLTPKATPVLPMSGLSKHWDLPRLFIKREDQSSELYGGNKVRKLEFLLGDAQAKGKKSVLTTGAWGSNHALATSLFSDKLGIRATLILVPQPPNDHVNRNYQACIDSGARIIRVPFLAAYPAYRAMGIAKAIASGEGWPYAIPPGGSNALGALGYVEAGLELAHQIASGDCPIPDYIYIPLGSCSSFAGLALGLGIAAIDSPALRKIQVNGVRVVPQIATSMPYVKWMQTRTLQLMRKRGATIPIKNPSLPIYILPDQLGKGYGHPTKAGQQAQKEALAHEHLTLEPTYTAKTLAGIHCFATQSPEHKAASHLYVHTLGTLASEL